VWSNGLKNFSHAEKLGVTEMDRLKNLNMYFWISLIVILMNYALLWWSWKLQNDLIDIRPQNWSNAIALSERVFFLIIIHLLLQVAFRVAKKTNTIEFLINSFINLMSFFPLLIVVANRI